MQNFMTNLLVIKCSLSEGFWITFTRNIEDWSWHALRERYDLANLSLKKSSQKRLKHTLVDSVFDANSKHVISFDTDCSLLIESSEYQSKKQRMMTKEWCAWILFKWPMFYEFVKYMIL